MANHRQLSNSLLHDEHQCQIQSDQESYLQKPESSNKLQKDEIKLHPTAPRTSWQQKTSQCPLTKEQESNIGGSEKRHYSQRLDRHGRPFGTRPSEKTTTPAYGSKPLNASPRYRIKETPRTQKSRSPTDSHSYQRQRKPSASRQDITPRNTSLVNQLRVDSRRRSLSFGTRTNGENLMWQEKIILSDEDHINTPFSTPLQNHVVTNTEVQLHENIMNELQDVTLQYVNVSDPVGSETRRQRVLEGEPHNLMAETAVTMLAHALTNGNQNGSNHALYATLEATENPGGQLAREDLVSEVERVSPEPTQPIQPRKRGRPPGKSGTTSKQPVLNGTGSKKHKVQAIQNSPGIRRSYSTQSIAEQQESKAGNKQPGQKRKPLIQKPPATAEQANPESGETWELSKPGKARKGNGSRPKPKLADFHNPSNSLP